MIGVYLMHQSHISYRIQLCITNKNIPLMLQA